MSIAYIQFSVYSIFCIYETLYILLCLIQDLTNARYLHCVKVLHTSCILRVVSEKILRPCHRSHTQNALKNAFFNIQIFVYLKTHIFRNLIIQIQHTYRTIIKKINHNSRHITTGLPIPFPMETSYSIRNASKHFLSVVSY